MAKLMNVFNPRNPINPLIGSAGVSAVPMAARVSHVEGQRYDPSNYLMMHAMGPNVAGVIGTAVAAGYFISTLEDHIAPWKSTYKGALNFGGPVRFVLGGSGHIAGIVNPPVANKYGYWLNPAAKLADEGMGVGEARRPGGGVAHMGDDAGAGQWLGLDEAHPRAVAGGFRLLDQQGILVHI